MVYCMYFAPILEDDNLLLQIPLGNAVSFVKDNFSHAVWTGPVRRMEHLAPRPKVPAIAEPQACEVFRVRVNVREGGEEADVEPSYVGTTGWPKDFHGMNGWRKESEGGQCRVWGQVKLGTIIYVHLKCGPRPYTIHLPNINMNLYMLGILVIFAH